MAGNMSYGREWQGYRRNASALGTSDQIPLVADSVPDSVQIDRIYLDLRVLLSTTTVITDFTIATVAELEALLDGLFTSIQLTSNTYGTLIDTLAPSRILRTLGLAFGARPIVFDKNGEDLRVGIESTGVVGAAPYTVPLQIQIPIYIGTDSPDALWTPGYARGLFGRRHAPYVGPFKEKAGGVFTVNYGGLLASGGGGTVSLGSVSYSATVASCSYSVVIEGRDRPDGLSGQFVRVSPFTLPKADSRSDDLIRLNPSDLTVFAYRSDTTIAAIATAMASGTTPGNAADLSAMQIELSGGPRSAFFDNGSPPAVQDWITRHRAIIRDIDRNGELRWIYGGQNVVTGTYAGDTGPLWSDLFGPTLVPMPNLARELYYGLPQIVGESRGSTVKTGSSTIYSIRVQPMREIGGHPGQPSGTVIKIGHGDPGLDAALEQYLPEARA